MRRMHESELVGTEVVRPAPPEPSWARHLILLTYSVVALAIVVIFVWGMNEQDRRAADAYAPPPSPSGDAPVRADQSPTAFVPFVPVGTETPIPVIGFLEIKHTPTPAPTKTVQQIADATKKAEAQIAADAANPRRVICPPDPSQLPADGPGCVWPTPTPLPPTPLPLCETPIPGAVCDPHSTRRGGPGDVPTPTPTLMPGGGN